MPPSTAGRTAVAVRLIAGRLLAAVSASFWGLLFFGVIDLVVVPSQDARFDDTYLLETGWGLLYTLLVMVPLMLWSVNPRLEVFVRQVLVVAVAVLLTGAAALAAGQVLTAGILALTMWAPVAVAGCPLRSRRGWQVSESDRWLGGLALTAVASCLWYAVQMLQASYTGAVDDDTWGLMHLPMQAAFALALAGSASITARAQNVNAPGWRLSVVPSAVSALWIGVVSVAYPGHVGSLGTVGGIGAAARGIAWAAAGRWAGTRTRLSGG